MDFSLSKEQTMLLKELDSFLKKEIEPIVDEYDSNKKLKDPSVLKNIFKRLEPFGAVSGIVPEEYGGMGLDYNTVGLIARKLAEYWGSLWGVTLIQSVSGRLLAEIQNEEIRQKYLSRVCTGEIIPCACITEPNVGSYPGDIETTMEKEGSEYIVNGTKTWISNGSVSDIAFVVASIDREKGPAGLGIILVDRTESPYESRELEKMGLKAFPTSELYFDNVRVPEENLVVTPGSGLQTVARTFELARALMASGSAGFSQAALKLALSYAKERVQWGKKIGEHQLVQEMIYEMRVRTDASAMLADRVLWMMNQDIRCDPEAALAKGYATEAAILTTKDCIQIMGGYGLSTEYAAERYYRDASCMTIPDGTTQIQKLIVARSMLGLSAF